MGELRVPVDLRDDDGPRHTWRRIRRRDDGCPQCQRQGQRRQAAAHVAAQADNRAAKDSSLHGTAPVYECDEYIIYCTVVLGKENGLSICVSSSQNHLSAPTTPPAGARGVVARVYLALR